MQNRGIRDSEAKGIIIIHQELALVPLLSIAENLFLGNEVASKGVINWPLAFQKTESLLKKLRAAGIQDIQCLYTNELDEGAYIEAA